MFIDFAKFALLIYIVCCIAYTLLLLSSAAYVNFCICVCILFPVVVLLQVCTCIHCSCHMPVVRIAAASAVRIAGGHGPSLQQDGRVWLLCGGLAFYLTFWGAGAKLSNIPLLDSRLKC